MDDEERNQPYSGRNRREFFRVVYPVTDRPTLEIDGKEYQIVDLSEFGIKFFTHSVGAFYANLPVRIQITFHDGKTLNLLGTILRLEGEGEEEEIAVILLSKEIPTSRIMKEQRYLINKYPTRR